MSQDQASQDQAQTVLASAVENQPKKRGCRRGCLIAVAVLALLAVPLVWFNIPTPLRVSEETTRVLGPMTSDGKRIDYFLVIEERLTPPEMKTDDNGYRLIVRASGVRFWDRHVHGSKPGEWIKQEFDPEPFRRQVYEKLGLDPNEPPTLTIESVDTFLERYEKEHSVEGLQQQWWGSNRSGLSAFDDFPMLEDWYEENTAGIDLLGEAVRKPAFFIPLVRENENTPIFDSLFFPDSMQTYREWARAAQARANYRLGIGDIDGAIDDIITIRLLGRHAGKQGTLVMGLVGIAIEGMGISIGIGSNPEFPPTKEQIERLVREIDALPPRATLNEVFEVERYFSLAAMQDMSWGNDPGFFLEPTPLLPFMAWSVDINIALARLNKVYDALFDPAATVDGKTLDEILEPSSWNPLALVSKRSRTNQIVDMLISLLLPSIEEAHRAWQRIECIENMQRLTLALLLYEKEHGTLPDGDWREAVRPYLETADGRRQTAADFRCPSHPGWAEEETTYAMIGGVPNATPSPNQILLVELREPQRLGEGDGRIPFAQAQFGDGVPTKWVGSHHPGGLNVGLRSGAVRFISQTVNAEAWQSLLDGTATSFP